MDYAVELKKRLNKNSDTKMNDEADIRIKLDKVRAAHPNTNKSSYTIAQRAAEQRIKNEAAQKNSLSNDMSYEEQKNFVKENRDVLKSNYRAARNDYAGKAIKGALTFWDSSDDITDEEKEKFKAVKSQYKSDKKAYNQTLDDIKFAEKNEREAMAYNAMKDSDTVKLLADMDAYYQQQADDAKQAAEQARQMLEATGNSNNGSAWQSYQGRSHDIAKGNQYTGNSAKYDNAVNALKEKGYSDKDIQDLYDYYKKDKDKKYTKEVTDIFDAMQDEGGLAGKVMANVASVSSKLSSDNKVAVAEDILYGLDARVNDRYVDANTNSQYHLGQNVSDEIRIKTSEDIQRNSDNSWIANFIYQTGMSMADFGATLPAASMIGQAGANKVMQEAASLGVLSTSAAVSKTKEATDNGLNADQAASLGIIAGAAEIITEHASIDALFNSSSTGIKYILQNALTEGSEEVGSDIINEIADLIISGDKADIKAQYQNYLNEGYSDKDAFINVLVSKAQEYGTDFLGGALSGGIMSGGATAINKVMQNNQYRSVGNELKKSGNAQAEINAGLAQDNTSKAYQAAAQMQSKLEQNAYTDNTEEFDYSQLNSRKLGRLAEYNAQEDARQLEKSAEVFEGDTAKSYVYAYGDNGYNGNVYDYNKGFNAVYMAQQQGKSINEAYDIALDEGSHITPIQATIAYDAAKNDTAVAEFKDALSSPIKIGATVVAKSVDKEQQSTISFINEMAKTAGVEVVIPARMQDVGLKDANGAYVNGKIVLPLDNESKMMNIYLGHEMFHHFKVTAPENANVLQNTVIERLKADASYNYEERLAQIINDYGFKGTREQQVALANEEIAANACFTVFSNEANVKQLVAQDRTLAQKVHDFFANMIDRMKKALEGLSKRNREYKALSNDIEAKEQIVSMFNDCLKESQKNNTITSDSEIKLSQKVKEPLDEFTQRVLDMSDEEAKRLKAEDTYVSIMSNTPPVILDNIKDADNLEVLMRFDSYYLETRHSGALDGNYHNLGMTMAELPDYIGNPDAIVRNYNGRLNLITAIGENKNRLISVELNTVKDINSKNSKYNLVVSVFNSKNKYVENVIKKAVSLEYEKEDLAQVNHQLHTSLATINVKSSTDNVPQSETSVNSNDMQDKGKYALKEDSEGNPLSDEQIKRYKNVAPELRDKKSRIKPFYHGTSRADRVGNYFNPDRATSGPMAYFTDNEKIADNYSKNKSDTSLAYDDEYDSYETQFRVDDKSITEYWYTLSPSEKRELTQKIQQVTLDDDDNIILKSDNKYGIGNFNDYELNMARGNALQVLVDGWLNGGTLWGDEYRFIDVLNAIGIKNAEYKNPDYREEKVYKVYLNITNPFNTDNVDEEFISDLEDYVGATDMSVYDAENAQADMWDKNSIDIYDWIERLKDDFANGTTHAWTSIPDVVTDFLKEYGGYNGIIDRGGKQGGEIHTVAIPFYSNQIKNVDNINPTDNEDIRYSKKESINVDEFDESGYDIINTTGKKGYAHFKSEVMTWDSDKYLDKIRLAQIDDKFYIYKMVSNDSRDIWIYKPKSQQSKNQIKEMREYYAARNYKGSIDAVEIVRNKRRYSNGNNELFRGQREKSRNNDKLNNNQVRGEGNSNRRGITQDDSDDYLQERQYSIKENPIDYNAVIEENAELSEMNEDLKEMLRLTSAENEKLKNEFKITDRHNISNNAVDKVAAALRKQYSSSYDKTSLVSRLAAMYDYMANAGKDIDSTYIWLRANDIAKNIIANSQQKDTAVYDEYKELRNRIRNTAIRVPQTVQDNFADYNAFRRENFGRLRLSKEGVELDAFYNELSAQYPEFFDTDVSEEQQLEALANFFEVTSPVYYSASEQNAESMGMNMEQYANLIAGDIIDKYFDVPEVMTAAEKHKKEMDTLKLHYRNQIDDMRQSYKYRYDERLKEVKAENAKRVTKLRADKADALAKQKAHFEDVSQRGKEHRKKSQLRNSIRKSLNKIARLGANPDKKKHIPNSIIDSVKALADVVNFDDTKQDNRLKERLNAFQDSFEAAEKNNQYSVISELYNDFIHSKLSDLKEEIGNTPLKELPVSTLEKMDELFKMTVQSINNINRLFLKDRNETIEKYAESISNELAPYKKEKMYKGMSKSLMYNSMKPEYFFQYLGSDTLLELYHDLRKGEDIWAVDISEARDYALKVRKKYGWQKWDNKHSQSFNTSYGEIELTLQERLAVYANSLGEHTKNHLYGGGFRYQKSEQKGLKKLRKQVNDNENHRLSESDVELIVSSLDENQKAYVRDMMNYLSTVMGQKGNGVSKELYGIEMFKEKMYYPAKVLKESTHQSTKEVRAEKQLKNAGFTNSSVKNAKQPLVLMDFDSVWASHVDEMSKYHAFVLPLENIDRVYNLYNVTADYEFTSIKQIIENAYGDKALTYIDDLIKDINGGVVHEAGTDFISKVTSLFKKNAVFASASVAVQQPSAIARAFSEVDFKYFVKVTGSGFSRKSYTEMKKYAPIAVIKEMGYFDTNMAQSTVDFLNNNDYEGVKEKLKAFVKDGSYRDEALSFFASKADEITWTHIWNACKAEVKANNSELTKEQQLEKAGERFTEVVTKTQVYDSVFSRSGLMRSRDSAVKNATAFMAEPTTSLNMLANAVVQAKRGNISKAKAGRVFASLVTASVFNSLLQTIVTAARADDDDKDWAEAYLSQLIPNFIDNLNPFNQIAFVKDIFNIFQGYDVTRADMNLFSDLYNAIDRLDSDKISTYKKITGLSGAIAAFFGLPVKNVIRDVESAFNVGKDFFDDKKFSSETAFDLFKEEMNNMFGFELFNADLDIALKAVEKGDVETYQEYADKIYATDDAYDLLYSILVKYGYNSSQYRTAENRCVEIKKQNGAKEPDPKSSMKKKALKEYAHQKKNGTYKDAEPLRQLCIQLYGDMTKVNEALEKLND